MKITNLKKTITVVALAMVCAAAAVLGLCGFYPEVAAQESADGSQVILTPGASAGTETGLGVRVIPASGKDEATFEYWNEIPMDELSSSIVKMVMAPETSTQAEARAVSIKISDPQNPDNYFVILLRNGKIDGQAVYAGAALSDDIEMDFDGWAKLRRTGNNEWANYQEIVGFNTASASYTAAGTYPVGVPEKDYDGVFSASEAAALSPIELSFRNGMINCLSNGSSALVADLKDDAFQTASTKFLSGSGELNEVLKTKYTDEYIDSILKAQQVKVSMHFYGVDSNGVSFVILQMGESKFDSTSAYDTQKPVGTQDIDAFTVLKEREDIEEILDEVLVFEDDFSEADKLTVTKKIYTDENKQSETTFAQASANPGAYFITVQAADEAGNLSDLYELDLTVLGAYEFPGKLRAEINTPHVRFPSLNLCTFDRYQVQLFEVSDTSFSNPLNKNYESYYEFSDVGQYVLRYTVYDRNLEKTVHDIPFEVIDSVAPEMTFEGDYDNVYSVGTKIDLLIPALADNNPSGEPQYTVSVNVGSDTVTVSDNSFIIDKAGSYKITYTAKDKSGNEVQRVFSFETGEAIDYIAPEITVNGQYSEELSAGSKLTIFDATVQDNSGETILPEILVTLGGKILEIEDGKVVLDTPGVCTVRYTATDQAGNVTSVSFKITVSGGGLSVWAITGIVAGCVVVVAAGVLATLFFVKKNKKQREDKLDD